MTLSDTTTLGLFLQEFLDTSPHGLVFFTPTTEVNGSVVDLEVHSFNNLAISFLGNFLTPGSGQVITQLAGMPAFAAQLPQLLAVAESGHPHSFDYQLADGWYNAHAARLYTGLLLTCTQQPNRQHDQSAELLHQLVNNIQVGIGLMSAVRGPATADGKPGPIIDLQWEMTNEANARITNLPVKQLIGGKMTELLPGTVESGFFANCIRVIETGESMEYEFPYFYDGLEGYYDVRIARQGDGILFSSLDISARRQAELALQQQAAALEQANAELVRSNENLQSFAYIASHDLQEPLRKIQSFGHLLRTQLGDASDPLAADYLERMGTASVRMSLLINDLLAYSRLTTQREPHQPVSLNDLVGEVEDDLAVAVQEADATLQIGTLPTLPGDRLQLRQLVQNLLSNAIKFRKANTPPLIQVMAQPTVRANVPGLLTAETTGSATDPFWVITVQDNGIGYDPKFAERIFMIFQRLHGRGDYPGTGIGLAIVKRVVDNHQGSIVAQSQPNVGSVFTVYLPA